MAEWEDVLQTASFDGVAFPVASRLVTGGRALARRRYPNRPGQSVEELGREPYAFELEIPLFSGVDPEHYPNTYDSLRSVFDDPTTGGLAEYVDTELGPLRAQVEKWSWRTVAGARDGGILTVVLEEVSFDDQVLRISVDSQGGAEDAARALDEGGAELGLDESALEQQFAAAGVPLTADEKDREAGELWSTQVARFVETLEDGISNAEAVADRIDALRARLDVLVSRDELQAPRAVPLHHAAVRLAAALGDLGAAALAKQPPLVEQVLATELSVYDVSVMLYGTADRADEILRRNPSAHPLFIPAGARLVVLSV